MTLYADTSFLFSLYVPDVHAAAAGAFIRTAQGRLRLTQLNELEFVNGLALWRFRKQLTARQASEIESDFRRDAMNRVITIDPLPADAYRLAAEISRRHSPELGTRSLDVQHVACALLLEAGQFLTFDRNQARLARAEALSVPLIDS